MSEPLDERRRLAHEMRNALGAVRTSAELLERRLTLGEREARLMKIVLSECDHLESLIDESFGRSRAFVDSGGETG